MSAKEKAILTGVAIILGGLGTILKALTDND